MIIVWLAIEAIRIYLWVVLGPISMAGKMVAKLTPLEEILSQGGL